MYTLHPTCVVRQADGLVIPLAEGNSDFEAFQSWLDEGNTPDAPPVVAPPPPHSVTMRQARLALLEAGKLAAVNAAIAAMPSPQKEAAQIEWEFAATVDRDSPFLQGLAPALQLDEVQLDALFMLAGSK